MQRKEKVLGIINETPGIRFNEIIRVSKIKKLLKTNLPIYAIDINSKFETKPGLKKIELIEEFKNPVTFKDLAKNEFSEECMDASNTMSRKKFRYCREVKNPAWLWPECFVEKQCLGISLRYQQMRRLQHHLH